MPVATMMITALGSSGSNSTFPVGPAVYMMLLRGGSRLPPGTLLSRHRTCEGPATAARSKGMHKPRSGHSSLPVCQVQVAYVGSKVNHGFTCHVNLIAGLGVTQEV